uniref:Uncharacterized protein n=1 Tax=Anopheles quadriannulatus TaxID=34691 RepID=A0A182XRS2_ANOQN
MGAIVRTLVAHRQQLFRVVKSTRTGPAADVANVDLLLYAGRYLQRLQLVVDLQVQLVRAEHFRLLREGVVNGKQTDSLRRHGPIDLIHHKPARIEQGKRRAACERFLQVRIDRIVSVIDRRKLQQRAILARPGIIPIQ